MKNVLISELDSNRVLLRHLDDVKKYNHCEPTMSTKSQQEELPSITDNPEELARNLIEEEGDDTEILPQQQLDIPDNFPDNVPILPQEEAREEIQPRRSTRIRKTRQRYIEIC